jgi:hypothetical protein
MRNHVCKSLPIDRKQEAESMKTIAIVGGLLMALTACNPTPFRWGRTSKGSPSTTAPSGERGTLVFPGATLGR